MEKLEQTISDLHNTIFNLQSISNSKSSQEDINQLQSKILKLQDANTALGGEVGNLVKLETVPEPFSEANGNSIVKQEGFHSEKTSEAEYFSRMKRYCPGEEQTTTDQLIMGKYLEGSSRGDVPKN